MAINDKDLKLLWYKAAGRCSICKKELSVGASSPSENTLIGQNCHIVGEKLDGKPRHKSNLNAGGIYLRINQIKYSTRCY